MDSINLCAGKIMAAFIRNSKGALLLACVGESRFEGATKPGKATASR